MISDRSSANEPPLAYGQGPQGQRLDAPFGAREGPIEKSLPKIQDLCRFWQSKRYANGLPRKIDLPPVDLKPYLGRISILSVLRDPDDFVYRLFGSEISELVKQELSGKSVRTLRPKSYASLAFDHFTEARVRSEPLAHLVCFWAGGQERLYQRVCLPLSEDGSWSVDYLMTYAADVSWDNYSFEQLYLGNDGIR